MQKKKSNFYRFYKDYFYSEFRYMFLLLFLIGIGILITNISPYIYGVMIDYTTGGEVEKLPKILIIYFLVSFLSLLLGLLESYFGDWFTYHISNHVKEKLFHKIIRMKCKRLDQYQTGELMTRLNADGDVIVDFFIDVATSILTIAFNLIIALVFVIKLSKTLTLVSILFIPMSVFVNLFFRKYYRNLHKIQKIFGDKFSSFIVTTFSNIMGLRAYCREDITEQNYLQLIQEQWVLIKKEKKISNVQNILSSIISSVSILVLIYMSALLIAKGRFSIGNMVSFMTYIGRLNSAVSQLLALNIQLQGIIVSLDRVYTLQDEPDEQDDYIIMPKDFEISGNILKVKDISFRYTQEKELVLEDFSLELNGKGLYSIVGLNGSGKSSFLKILIKYYSLEKGVIDIDGWNISDIDSRELRKKLVYVPKETYIINDTIINNLLIANPTATEKNIVKVCELVGLDKFTQYLPEKYNTKVGENGKLLSSGQKQKLCIARAILCNPIIYLFDEITSDLDGKAEKDIIEIIKTLSEEKMVLMVTHRLTSVINSKKIFLFEEKKISCSGTHQELLNSSILYRQLFEQQAEKIKDFE